MGHEGPLTRTNDFSIRSIQIGSRRRDVTNTARHVIFYCCCALALAAKLYCASTTYGTNDTGLFLLYGQAVAEAGLEQTYAAAQHFNHTPLLASILAGLYWLAQESTLSYPLLLRLPGIFADLITCVMLWRLVHTYLPGRVSTGWCCLFALSPLSFMVSGYHGNFDSVMAMFLFLAAYHCISSRVELSALFLALAIHVKVAPLILTPVFFFFWLARQQGLRFFWLTTMLVLAVWLVPLLQYPGLFLHNVLGYSSYWGTWGITYWLRETGYAPFHLVSFYGLEPIQRQIMLALKISVGITILFLAWRRGGGRRADIFTTLSAAWAIFFVFAPGILLHYLVWPSCFFLLCSRGLYLVLLLTGSIFVGWCYTVINGRIPWDRGLFRVEVLEMWLPWSNLAWVGFALTLAAMVFGMRRSEPTFKFLSFSQPRVADEA